MVSSNQPPLASGGVDAGEASHREVGLAGLEPRWIPALVVDGILVAWDHKPWDLVCVFFQKSSTHMMIQNPVDLSRIDSPVN